MKRTWLAAIAALAWCLPVAHADAAPSNSPPRPGLPPPYMRFIAPETITSSEQLAILNDLNKQLARRWYPPKNCDTKPKISIVRFTLDTEGHIVDPHGITKSGERQLDHNIFDNAALDAVKRLKQYRPLPDGFPPKVEVEAKFVM